MDSNSTVTLSSADIPEGYTGRLPDLRLAHYRSHKLVGAAKIEGIDTTQQGSVVVLAEGSARWGGKPVEIKLYGDMAARIAKEALVGDYIVQYADGYVSWSPRAAFEDGYDKVDA